MKAFEHWKSKAIEGFTLIELLVVIAIIAIGRRMKIGGNMAETPKNGFWGLRNGLTFRAMVRKSSNR